MLNVLRLMWPLRLIRSQDGENVLHLHARMHILPPSNHPCVTSAFFCRRPLLLLLAALTAATSPPQPAPAAAPAAAAQSQSPPQAPPSTCRAAPPPLPLLPLVVVVAPAPLRLAPLHQALLSQCRPLALTSRSAAHSSRSPPAQLHPVPQRQPPHRLLQAASTAGGTPSCHTGPTPSPLPHLRLHLRLRLHLLRTRTPGGATTSGAASECGELLRLRFELRF